MRPSRSPVHFFGGLMRGASFLVMAFASMVALAGSSEPWKDKEYKVWTQDEVQKILYESPWVKMVEVSAPWLKGRMQYLTPLPTDCDGRPDMNRGDRTPTSWQLGGNESIVIYQVVWQSARTVRALSIPVRLRWGASTMKTALAWGHLPLRLQTFMESDPLFLTHAQVKPEELDGYNMWKESSDGGVWE